MYLQDLTDGKVTIEIVVQDSGIGMSNEKLDALFRDLEQVTTDGDEIINEADERRHLMDGKENRTLGLGLASKCISSGMNY